MHLDYYKSAWDSTKKKSRQEIEIKGGVKLYRFNRNYNGAEAVFYTTTGLLDRKMYISLGPSLQKLVESYVLITEKCTKSSVKKAFSKCPNLVKWIKRYLSDSWVYTPITVLSLSDSEHEFCLYTDYTTIFSSKRFNFKELRQYADIIRNESQLIDKNALEIKLTFAQKCKKVAKYAIKIGVIGLAVIIGADLELPDFDFDFDMPDIDVDVPDLDFADVDIPDLEVLPIDPTGMSVQEASEALESISTYEYIDVSIDPTTDATIDPGILSEANPIDGDLNLYYEEQYDQYFADSQREIDSIYDSRIKDAEDTLKADTERINKKGPYSWEDAEQTIRRDNDKLESLINAKKEALAQAKVDARKMAHWDSVTKHTKDVLSKKIGG